MSCILFSRHPNPKAILVIVALLCINLTTRAQDILLKMDSVTVRQAMTQLKNRTGYSFVYKVGDIDTRKVVNVNARKLDDAIQQILQGQDIAYTIRDQSIILTRTFRVSHSESGYLVKTVIRGVVTDMNNEPIIGANVLEEGSMNGVITDIDGKFTIAVNNNAKLRISFIGFVDTVLDTRHTRYFNVSMFEDNRLLDEIVVVAYGTTVRKDIIGAIGQIRSFTLGTRPVNNLTQALQGTAANLIIQQRSHDPNDQTTNINIRGVGTMGSNNPLIVIDGVAQATNTMNNLNVEDIESISILKDAGSAAIYGSRSANGVILITTKQGAREQKPTLNFSTQLGITHPKVLHRQVPGWINAILTNEAFYNGGASEKYTAEQIQDLRNNEISTPFVNQILKNGLQRNYNLNLQGGSQNTSYMISGNIFDQESNLVGPDYGVRRYNFRTNLTNYMGERLKLTTNISYTRNENKATVTPPRNLISDAMRIPLNYYYKFKSDDGAYYYTNDILSSSNPLALLESLGYTDYDNDHLSGSYNAEFTISDGLKIKGIVGYIGKSEHQASRTFDIDYAPISYVGTTPIYSTDIVTISNTNRNGSDTNSKSTFLNTQVMLDFDKSIGVHHLNGLVGYSDESFRFMQSYMSKDYLDQELGIPISETVFVNSSSLSRENTINQNIRSSFLRAGYSYNDKYYGEFSLRFDSSSKFSHTYRNGWFPSISGGWRVSDEPFMAGYANQVGDLKLRSSFGILGNQDNVGDYEYQTTYGLLNNTYAFNNKGVSGVSITDGNEIITWERSKTFNTGFDATFLHNSLSVSFDYFYKRTSGILLNPVVPATFGGSISKQNIGVMDNTGWELSVAYQKRWDDLDHHLSFNLADSKNKVIAYGDPYIYTGGGVGHIIREGLPYRSYFGYKVDGIFKDHDEIASSAIPLAYEGKLEPGDVKYVDWNKDGMIDEKDRVALGNAFPRYTFGLNYNVSWRGFDLGLLFQGVMKRDMMIRGELIEPIHESYVYTLFEHQLDTYWTPDNREARYPRLSKGNASYSNNWQMVSDIWKLNGAYLRLKNIQLGFTLPKDWISKYGCNNLRIYVDAQNLFTLSHNSFIDPESSEFSSNMSGGYNSARSYPVLKYVGVGINIGF